MSLYSETLHWIRRRRLLNGVGHLVVGLSGGPDSVCLLDLLALMVERGDLDLTLHAAHLNHGLRGADADADALLARQLAEAHGLPITVRTRDVGKIQATQGGSLEEVARRERYDFLAGVAEATGAQAVAVGHHADDQAETVLHRMIRGAGLKGLRGMPPSRLIGDGSPVRLVRPLLGARRKAILAYLQERGLTPREDRSNSDPAFLRNRIRHQLLPLLETEYNPAIRNALCRLARSAEDAYELLLDVAHTAAVDCVDGPRIEAELFGLVHGAARPLVIDAAVEAVASPAPQFDAAHYEAISDLAFTGRSGAMLNLPGGIVVRHTGDTLEFSLERGHPSLPICDIQLAVPGQTSADEVGFTIAVREVSREGFDLAAFLVTKTRYDEVMDAEAVHRPLVLRTRRDGDTFRPLGLGGAKSVSDFLTDVKAPADERERTLVMCDTEGVIWLVGHRLDDRVKVTGATRRLLVVSLEQ